MMLRQRIGDLIRRAYRGQFCDPPVDGVKLDGDADEAVACRLKELFDSDQAERTSRQFNWAAVAEADRARRREVIGYLREGRVGTPEALYHAAMIFQHGNCPEHYQLANTLAERAMDAGEHRARWLYAATLDRFLVSRGKPQKFGTQYHKGPRSKWELYPVDPATTDEERERYHIPSLDVARLRAEEMNRGEADTDV